MDWVVWAPWHRYKGALDADGDLPEGVPVEEREAPVGRSGEKIVFIKTRETPPRDFFISKKDCEKHGYTRGCGGCSSCFRGLGKQPHSEKCQARFAELMRDEAKLKNQ